MRGRSRLLVSATMKEQRKMLCMFKLCMVRVVEDYSCFVLADFSYILTFSLVSFVRSLLHWSGWRKIEGEINVTACFVKD